MANPDRFKALGQNAIGGLMLGAAMRVSPWVREQVQNNIDREQWILKARLLGADIADLERYEAAVKDIAAQQAGIDNIALWRHGWELLIERLAWGQPVKPTDPRAWGVELMIKAYSLEGWLTTKEVDGTFIAELFKDLAYKAWVKYG